MLPLFVGMPVELLLASVTKPHDIYGHDWVVEHANKNSNTVIQQGLALP